VTGTSADGARCLVVVPYRDSILPVCEDGLRALEARGYTVWRDGGRDAIDHKRSRLATRALAASWQELFWIDSDIGFDPGDVERLRSHHLPLVGGLYARRGQRELCYRPLREMTEMSFGQGSPRVEVHSIATGFLLTHRNVYEAMADAFDLPVCDASSGEPVVPYFLPMVVHDPDLGDGYLSEDYAFCERARQAGHTVMLDPSIRLSHLGGYGYGWEDVAPVARIPHGKLRLGRR
jgi:hypothetical protein